MTTFALLGCASNEPKYFVFPDNDDNARPHPASYTADLMVWKEPMRSRPNPKPWVFYYKGCEDYASGSFISKTAYTCEEPYY